MREPRPIHAWSTNRSTNDSCPYVWVPVDHHEGTSAPTPADLVKFTGISSLFSFTHSLTHPSPPLAHRLSLPLSLSSLNWMIHRNPLSSSPLSLRAAVATTVLESVLAGNNPGQGKSKACRRELLFFCHKILTSIIFLFLCLFRQQ